MKLVKLVASIILVGTSLSVFAAGGWQPFTGTCTETVSNCWVDENGVHHGDCKTRSGSNTNCMESDSGSCTVTPCVYGPWTACSC